MRKLLFFLLLIPLACSRKQKLPEGILAQPKMQAVMWDMLRAGEFLSGYVYYRDTISSDAAVSKKWFDKIYQIHHISSDQFRKSFDYYTAHPAMMREIMDSLSKKPAPPVRNEPQKYGQAPKKDSAKAGPGLIAHQQRAMDSIMRKAEQFKKRKRKPIKPTVLPNEQ